MPQYGVSNAGAAWASQPQQIMQTSQSPYGTFTSNAQLQTGHNPVYSQYVQQDAYSAEPLRSNGSLSLHHSRSYPSISRYQQIPAYTQQPNQSYDTRTSRDAYQSLRAPPAAASIADSGIVANQSHDDPASTLQTASSTLGMTGGLLPTQQVHHDRNVERTAAHYSLHAIPMHSTNHSYQTHGPTDAMYAPNTQQELKYSENNYHHTHSGMYSDGPAPGAVSDTSLPLDSGMLNRSFAPAYEDTNGHGMDNYKQEPAPYPTPNQTSPMG